VTCGKPPLLVILGPTAAGKSAVAHEVALVRSGEIVSADAFAVYRGLDIGTAKPTPKERREVRYHMLDVVSPSETFSAGRWARDARRIIEDIAARGKLPIVCGGSGFYIEALLEGLPEGDARSPDLRAALARWGAGNRPVARRFLEVNDPESAARIAPGNLRYILRAIEILLSTGVPASSRRRDGGEWAARWRLVKVGVRPSREDLYARIASRVRRMLDAGWDAEVRQLLAAGISTEADGFRAIGYREVAEWVTGLSSREETEEKIVAATRALAKRQRTWFARESAVEWIEPGQAVSAALERLGPDRGGGGSGKP
jgi:tRNA dimethylallyltransferase